MKLTLLVLVGCLMFYAISALAFPVKIGPVDVATLLKSSDLACSGTVTAIEDRSSEVGTFYGSKMALTTKSVTVRTQHCFKAGIDYSVLNFKYDLPSDKRACESNPCVDFQQNSFYLFFLRYKDGVLTLTSDSSSFPISALTAKPDVEWAASRMRDDLISGLRDPDKRKVIENIRLLGGLAGDSTVESLRGLLPSATNDVRGWSYLSLLRLGDTSALTDIAAFLQDPASKKAGYVVTALIQELKSVRGPEAVPALMHIASFRDQQARYCAIEALRSIRDPRSVPILINALSDSSEDVRYEAVMGLAEIEGKGEGWATSFDIYAKSEKTYLDRWRDWWDSEGKAKYGSQS